MATIKAIQASSVHQIQSGQVIVDLCSVAKELVENSLDAGASSIEVRFKSYGLDSIEVQDNGNGIASENYEAIALKHYTSKLSSYDDLDDLHTYGFRGEALSSLCALSDFHIITATAEAGSKGSRLDFEVSGKLKDTGVVAAQKGTTVSVERLFHNLPVRRRELERNIKREYGKVLNLLQAYACICINVRFAVSNQPAKGKKMTAFATKSNPTTRENIANVYSAKTLLALTTLDLVFEMQSSGPVGTQHLARQDTSNIKSGQVQVQGHMSRPVHGEGRQAPDRQMFFVNSRPCLLPQISKAFNEVYRSYNVSQSPFIFANLIMDTNTYDVNVSPDKRTILLHDQTAMIDSLKTSLAALFDNHDQTVPTSQLQSRRLPAFRQPTLLRGESSNVSNAEVEAGESASAIDSPGSEADSANGDVQPRDRLVDAWVGRDAESRHKVQRDAPGGALVSDGKLKLADTFAARNEGQIASPRSVDSNSQSASSQSQGGVKYHMGEPEVASNELAVPRVVQQFNARMQSQELKRTRSRITTETVELEDDNERADRFDAAAHDSDSEGLPAVNARGVKATSGPLQTAFDRMRPKRPQDDVATVTIGGHTTRMTLDTPEAKRVRVHTPKTNATAMSSSGSRLRSNLRAFAAPGTQLFASEGEDDDDRDDGSTSRTAPRVLDEASEVDEDDGNVDDLENLREEVAPLGDGPPDDTHDDADDSDGEYLDEEAKRSREDARIARLIQQAEEAAARPTADTLKRASQVFRAGHDRKDAPLRLEQVVELSYDDLIAPIEGRYSHPRSVDRDGNARIDDIGDVNAEDKLSLTISKADFATMRIAGQFNLGFILAIRPGNPPVADESTPSSEDHLFIIDQHAADEKFNFERLSATMTLTAQRLVTPKDLHLSAVEEELIQANHASLIANGFTIEISDPETDQACPSNADGSSSFPQNEDDFLAARVADDERNNATHRQRAFRLVTLPTSKETTFSVADLEELLHLLSETTMPSSRPDLDHDHDDRDDNDMPATHSSETYTAHPSQQSIIRPSRVRRMLAMRACRSSIMVGRTLTAAQMARVVSHMGEMDRPWNCPHGRPTMRHLAGLGEWEMWDEDVGGGGAVDWRGFLAG